MPSQRVGVWLIGAKGGVATTMMTGLAALQRGTLEPVGLFTATPVCAGLDLVGRGAGVEPAQRGDVAAHPADRTARRRLGRPGRRPQ